MKKTNSTNQQLVDINQPIYHTWQGLYLSFYSRAFYVDVLKRWKGTGLLHLLLVLMIVCLPLSIKLGLALKDKVDEEIVQMVKKVPTFTILDGKASINKPQPYLIKNSKGVVTCYIDTRTDADSKTFYKHPQLIFYIARDGLFFRTPLFQVLQYPAANQSLASVKFYPFSKIKYEVVNIEKIIGQSHLNFYFYFIPFALYLLMLGMLFVVFGLFFLATAGLAKFVARIVLRTPLTYAQSSRLLIMSMTPALVILFYFLYQDHIFTGLGAILMCITAVYFSLAVQAYRKEAMQLARM